MSKVTISRRSLLQGASAVPLGAVFAPAMIGKARAAALKMRLSSSQPDDPKYANGRVYYDNLVKELKANGLAGKSRSRSSPTTSLARKSTSSIRSSSA